MSSRFCRFADAVFKSLGTIELTLAALYGILTILVSIYTVAADVPPLLGLDVLHADSRFTNRVIKGVVSFEEGENLEYAYQ